MKTINVADITLKKLSEDREVSLLFREKSAIAACADALGYYAIELPAVKNLREDTIIYKTIKPVKRNNRETLYISPGTITHGENFNHTFWITIKLHLIIEGYHLICSSKIIITK
jgi:hypothetical protein